MLLSSPAEPSDSDPHCSPWTCGSPGTLSKDCMREGQKATGAGRPVPHKPVPSPSDLRLPMDIFIQKTIIKNSLSMVLPAAVPSPLLLPRARPLLSSSHHPAWSSTANTGRLASQCQYFCAARARRAGCGQQRLYFALEARTYSQGC